MRRARLVDKTIGRDTITLLCAPAGSGKTLATADWAETATAGGASVAWLTLEDRDDRPYEFWSAVIEALIVAATPETARRLGSLSPPQQGLEPGFVVALTEVLITQASPHWLVLDDAHRLTDPDVLAGLDMLLPSAPGGLRSILLCRSEPAVPFHRWRLDGVLGEVRAPDLAFTQTEAEEMLASVETQLDQADVARLVARTEGWAAGLRLAVISLEANRDPGQFLAAFEGNQRPVSDYLFSEIVQHLDPELRDFLVATCAPEQLSVELAAHLSGRRDAGAVLDRLCRANALVVQSGDSSWYRYHSLLRGYLQAALARRDVQAPQEQHARTAMWFDRHDEPARALDHAARSGDDELLRGLIRRTGLRLVLSGQAAMVLDTLGPPSERFADDGSVAVVAALAALDVGDIPAADEWLAFVQRLGRPGKPVLSPLHASASLQRALLGGDVPAVLASTGILDVGPTGDPDIDLMVLAYRAPGRMRTGDYHDAVADLERALQISEARGYDQFVLYSLSQLAGMSGTLCDFGASFVWSHRAIEFATDRGWGDSPRLAYAYLIAAWTAFQTGNSADQSQFADRGLRALSGVDNIEVEMGVRSMHALAQFESTQGRGRYEAAEAFHRLWQRPEAAVVSPALNSLATQQEVRVALAVGRVDWAREATARLQQQLPDSAECVTLRAGLKAARGRVDAARECLTPVLDGRVPAHMATTRVVAQILSASLEASSGHPQRAFDSVREALAWAAPNNFRRPFLDAWTELAPLLGANRGRFGAAEEFVAELIADQRGTTDQRVSLLNHFLTEREFDVLRDLPSIMTIGEIAAAQGVSENTVKSHLRAVYQKLGVTGRAAAVSEARNRGLL